MYLTDPSILAAKKDEKKRERVSSSSSSSSSNSESSSESSSDSEESEKESKKKKKKAKKLKKKRKKKDKKKYRIYIYTFAVNTVNSMQFLYSELPCFPRSEAESVEEKEQEDLVTSTVRPEEIPPVPENRFLMRRSPQAVQKSNEEAEKDQRNKEQRPRERLVCLTNSCYDKHPNIVC